MTAETRETTPTLEERQVTVADANRMLDEINEAIVPGDPDYEAHFDLTPVELTRLIMYRTRLEAADELARLKVENEALRSALTKIAAYHTPWPEVNMEGYGAMAVVTAREALTLTPDTEVSV